MEELERALAHPMYEGSLKEVIFVFPCTGQLPKNLLKHKATIKKIELYTHVACSKFPTGLYELDKLTALDLRSSELMVIPSGVGKLQHLKKLKIYGSPDLTLPEDFVELKKLKTVHFSNFINARKPFVGKMPWIGW